MSFNPPHGKSCANCANIIPEGYVFSPAPTDGSALDDACAAGPYLALCPKRRHCGHWRGSADVRCGGCKWRVPIKESPCPRMRFDAYRTHPTRPVETAFACSRWEAADSEKESANEV